MLQASRDLRPPDWRLQTRTRSSMANGSHDSFTFFPPSPLSPSSGSPPRCSMLSIPRVPSVLNTIFYIRSTYTKSQSCGIVETHSPYPSAPLVQTHPAGAEIFTLNFFLLFSPARSLIFRQATPKNETLARGVGQPISMTTRAS